MSETVSSAVASWPSQGANKLPRPTAFKSARRDAPERRLRMSCQMKPMMTTDSMVGRKMQRAVDAAAGEPRQAEQHGEPQADAVLHHHVDRRRRSGCCGARSRTGPTSSDRSAACRNSARPTKLRRARLVAGIEAEADRVDQRIDREEGVDRKRRRQEHRRCGRESASGRGTASAGLTLEAVRSVMLSCQAKENGDGGPLLGERPASVMQRLLLVRLVPAGEAVLDLLGRLLRLHACRSAPGRSRSRARSRGSACRGTGSGRSCGSSFRRCRASRRTSAATGSFTSTLALESGKKPGSALA